MFKLEIESNAMNLAALHHRKLKEFKQFICAHAQSICECSDKYFRFSEIKQARDFPLAISTATTTQTYILIHICHQRLRPVL